MEFLQLSRRRFSAQNVQSGEERGETDVFAGQNNQGLGKGYQPQPITPTSALIILDSRVFASSLTASNTNRPNLT